MRLIVILFMKNFFIRLSFWTLLLTGCTTELTELRTGDLLFVGGKSDMDKAIKESTGQFTHVAIVVRDSNNLYVYDATPRFGVRQWTYQEFMNNMDEGDTVIPMRIEEEFDEDHLRCFLADAVGTPYDSAFSHNNDRFYCSELVYRSFLDSYCSEYLFAVQRMNWRDKEGNIPDYWVEWFNRVGVPVPEGEWGTNPNDMFHSSFLKPIRLK